METNRQIAKRLLVHYFQTCFNLAGVIFDGDNRVEIEAIIDAIFDEIESVRPGDPPDPDPALHELPWLQP